MSVNWLEYKEGECILEVLSFSWSDLFGVIAMPDSCVCVCVLIMPNEQWTNINKQSKLNSCIKLRMLLKPVFVKLVHFY